VQSVVASQVGYPEAALEYFLDACAVDLLDVHGNTADGIHIASCGGTWLALVAGFGGLRDSDGELRFSPRLPAEWERLRFRVAMRGQLIEVDMTHRHTTYRLLDGPGLMISDRGEQLRMAPGVPVLRPVVAVERADDDVDELPRAA
jgi:alpha,alpha-trehalose phosphorylase